METALNETYQNILDSNHAEISARVQIAQDKGMIAVMSEVVLRFEAGESLLGK